MSVQLNKLFIFAVIVMISFFVTSCAVKNTANPIKDIKQSRGQTTISAEEIKLYHDSQQIWLSSLQEDMSLEAALKQVSPYLQYFFEYKKSGKLFQYFQGVYPKTCMMFGLLFEDGRLTNLILDKAVNDFIWYRYNYAREWGHLFQYWLPNGLQKGVAMVRQHNRLGGEYDDVSNACQQVVKDNAREAKTTEAIITSLFLGPFIAPALVAMPFMPEDETGIGQKEIAKTTNEKYRNLAKELELGVTTDKELIKMLGTPANKDNDVLSYKNPYTKFGILNGIVIWSESAFTAEVQ